MERLGTVAIVGVGLIGGSVGLAVRARGLAERVVGIGRDQARLAEGVRLGAIDVGTTSLQHGVDVAEVVVVCTPVTRIADDICRVSEAGPAGMLITDAGSTKRRLVEAVEAHPRARAMFVGGHPIAGSERKGVQYAVADLFEGRVCVLTPTEKTPADRLDRARAFWPSLGCRLIETSPAEHDASLALTSHLPHAVAAALAGTVPLEALAMAAGAYRDGTRVAGADGSLWAGIFRENRTPTLRAIQEFRTQLAELESALADDDAEAIVAWWNRGRARRERFERINGPRAGES